MHPVLCDCLRPGGQMCIRDRENTFARRLYEKLGFIQLGTIPGGFRRKDGEYVDICPYYREL